MIQQISSKERGARLTDAMRQAAGGVAVIRRPSFTPSATIRAWSATRSWTAHWTVSPAKSAFSSWARA